VDQIFRQLAPDREAQTREEEHDAARR
jgi:hypothetical protein